MIDDWEVVLRVAVVVPGKVALLADVAGAVVQVHPLQLVLVAFQNAALDQEVVLVSDMVDNLLVLLLGLSDQQVGVGPDQDSEVKVDMVDVAVPEMVPGMVDQQLMLELGMLDLYVEVARDSALADQAAIWCLDINGQNLKREVDKTGQGLMSASDMVGLDMKLLDIVDLTGKGHWVLMPHPVEVHLEMTLN